MCRKTGLHYNWITSAEVSRRAKDYETRVCNLDGFECTGKHDPELALSLSLSHLLSFPPPPGLRLAPAANLTICKKENLNFHLSTRTSTEKRSVRKCAYLTADEDTRERSGNSLPRNEIRSVRQHVLPVWQRLSSSPEFRREFRVNGIFARERTREKETSRGRKRGIRWYSRDRKRPTCRARVRAAAKEAASQPSCRRYRYEESASRQCVSGTHVPFGRLGLRFFSRPERPPVSKPASFADGTPRDPRCIQTRELSALYSTPLRRRARTTGKLV